MKYAGKQIISERYRTFNHKQQHPSTNKPLSPREGRSQNYKRKNNYCDRFCWYKLFENGFLFIKVLLSSGSFGFIFLFVFQYSLEKFTLLILWNLRCFTIEVFAAGFSSFCSNS
jgi:hypothetical protein